MKKLLLTTVCLLSIYGIETNVRGSSPSPSLSKGVLQRLLQPIISVRRTTIEFVEFELVLEQADIESFLHGDLKTTYDLFSDLMLELLKEDTENPTKDLTDKLNETLDAVNTRIPPSLSHKQPKKLSTPLTHHLIGYNDSGDTSNFSITTLGKLKTIANFIDHPEKDKIVRIIEDIVRAATVQSCCKTVEQLNNKLKNNDKNSRPISAAEFAEIQRIIDKAHRKWLEDWMSVSSKL